MEYKTEKPQIIVGFSTQCSEKRMVDEICFGMEEEGVFYKITEVDDTNEDNAVTAHNLCKMSKVDISVLYTSDELILHQIKLPIYSPLFRDKKLKKDRAIFRKYGKNAARLLKNMGFDLK